MNTLNSVATTAPSGTEIVFDFATPATTDAPVTIAGRNVLAARVEAAGEPFKSRAGKSCVATSRKLQPGRSVHLVRAGTKLRPSER